MEVLGGAGMSNLLKALRSIFMPSQAEQENVPNWICHVEKPWKLWAEMQNSVERTLHEIEAGGEHFE